MIQFTGVRATYRTPDTNHHYLFYAGGNLFFMMHKTIFFLDRISHRHAISPPRFRPDWCNHSPWNFLLARETTNYSRGNAVEQVPWTSFSYPTFGGHAPYSEAEQSHKNLAVGQRSFTFPHGLVGKKDTSSFPLVWWIKKTRHPSIVWWTKKIRRISP